MSADFLAMLAVPLIAVLLLALVLAFLNFVEGMMDGQ